jgi:hypothetical protein
MSSGQYSADLLYKDLKSYMTTTATTSTNAVDDSKAHYKTEFDRKGLKISRDFFEKKISAKFSAKKGP